MNRSIDRADIVSQRLHNQRLTFSDFKKPVDVVEWHGAMQAQDFNGAKWALAQRLTDGTEARIQKAFDEGKILRTHVMRQTWHFVAPKDIRWLLKLSAGRINTALGSSYRALELSEETFKQSNKALTRALKGGKHLNRSSLRRVLNDAGIAADHTIRLAHILVHAELDGVICSGPRVGNQLTYALLDERVPDCKPLDRDEALAKLTRRYFMSHGPATFQDFMWWSGLRATDAKNGMALVERELTKTFCDEKTYWGPPLDGPTQRRSRSAHLLPPFDEYTVAYKNRETICELDPIQLSRTLGGILGPVVIVQGKVVGTWKLTDIQRSSTIAVKTFIPLNRTESLAITRAADRYATYRALNSKKILKIVD